MVVTYLTETVIASPSHPAGRGTESFARFWVKQNGTEDPPVLQLPG
jgi:hypothetical protein